MAHSVCHVARDAEFWTAASCAPGASRATPASAAANSSSCTGLIRTASTDMPTASMVIATVQEAGLAVQRRAAMVRRAPARQPQPPQSAARPVAVTEVVAGGISAGAPRSPCRESPGSEGELPTRTRKRTTRPSSSGRFRIHCRSSTTSRWTFQWRRTAC